MKLGVQQCRRAVGVPIFVGTEEVPVWAPQKRSKENEHHPQDDEAEQERGNREPAFLESVVPVAAGILIHIGNGDQADYDQAGEDHARQPGVEVDQHLL